MHWKLKERRKEYAKLTQKEIAKMLGINETSYIRKENGKTQFTVDEVIKLLNILECDFKDIFVY